MASDSEAWAVNSCSSSCFGTAPTNYYYYCYSSNTFSASVGTTKIVRIIEIGGIANIVPAARKDSVVTTFAEECTIITSCLGFDFGASSDSGFVFEAAAAILAVPQFSFSGTDELLRRPGLDTFGAVLSSCGAASSGVLGRCT